MYSITGGELLARALANEGVRFVFGLPCPEIDPFLVTLVMADGEWTMEIPNQMARYGQTFGTRMGAVRWDIVAQGLGCHGEFVQTHVYFGPTA